MILLSANGLGRQYAGAPIFEDVAFELRTGERIDRAGPNDGGPREPEMNRERDRGFSARASREWDQVTNGKTPSRSRRAKPSTASIPSGYGRRGAISFASELSFSVLWCARRGPATLRFVSLHRP